MVTDSIELRYAVGNPPIRVRELTGRDERSISGTSTADAIRLLDPLIEPPQQGVADTLTAADLTAADRDRLLAAVYQRAFGDRIESTLNCARCSQRFDLHFSLRHLVSSVEVAGQPDTDQSEPGNTARFRIPTGRDELALSSLTAAEAESLLLNRCVDGGQWTGGAQRFQEMLEGIAPLLDLELSAHCPECEHRHTVQFDIQSYLLGALMGEQHKLMTEIHRLAVAYGWSLDQILSLTRTERRLFVELIGNENARRSRIAR
jgi:hypothetical protein